MIRVALRHIEAKGVHDLTITNMIEHKIEVIPGPIPIRHKMRPIPPHYMEQLQESIKDIKKANLIERSNSPWS